MITKLNRIIITILASTFTQHASAFEEDDTRWYQVEIIIFEALDHSFGAEDWGKTIQLPATPDNTFYFPFNIPTPDFDPAVYAGPDQTLAMEAHLIPASEPEWFEPNPEAKRSMVDTAQRTTIVPLQKNNNVTSSTDGVEGEQLVEPPPPFELVDEGKYFLKRQSGKLLESETFEPLVHLSWIQPLDLETQIPVFISEGIGIDLAMIKDEHQQEMSERLDNIEPQDETTVTEGLIEPPTIENEKPSTEEMGPALPRLHGTVTLTRGRYLHLETRLSLEKSIPAGLALGTSAGEIQNQMVNPDEASTETTTLRFLHNEKRRLKREEIHYLDHPTLGVIVRVVQAKEPLPN